MKNELKSDHSSLSEWLWIFKKKAQKSDWVIYWVIEFPYQFSKESVWS